MPPTRANPPGGAPPRAAAALAASSALLSGLALGLSFPPAGHPALAWLALAPLLHALALAEGRPRRRAALGAAAGLVFSAWLIAWTMPAAGGPSGPVPVPSAFQHAARLALAGIEALLLGAVPITIFAAAAGPVLGLRNRGAALLGTAALWTGIEHARCEWFGFPWGALGLTQPPGAALSQNADLFGLPGLGFLLAASNAAVALFFARGGRLASPRRWVPLLCVLAAAALLGARGGWISTRSAAEPPSYPIALVQFGAGAGPNGDPVAAGAAITRAMMRNAAAGRKPALALWPRLAGDRKRLQETGGADALGRLESETGAVIIAGLADAGDPAGEEVWLSGKVPVWFPPSGPARSTPFLLLPRLDASAPPPRRMAAVIAGRDLEVSALCRAAAAWGAGLILSPGGAEPDASEKLAGLRLSLHRLRAIENRRWIAAASRDGISAVIDARGRVRASIGYGIEGALVEPAVLSSARSLHALGGWVLGPACLAAGLVLAAGLALRAARSRRRPPEFPSASDAS